MSGHRLTIGVVLGLVAAVAVGLATLRSLSALGMSLVFTATLGLLLASVPAAIYREGARRAFWLGFALFGWSYLVACFAPWFDRNVEPYLLTTRLINEAHNRTLPGINAYANASMIDWNPVSQRLGRFNSYDVYYEKQRRFRRIGHCLAGLLIAFAGGAATRMVRAGGPRG